MTKRIVITVDGLAGSGKSTLARLLANKLEYRFLNSGITYRYYAYLAKKDNVVDNVDAILELIKNNPLELKLDKKLENFIFHKGKNITSLVYNPSISEATSIISSYAPVRNALYDVQRNAFVPHPLVAEGRDMGTVVFDDADIKFFVTADVEIRMQRRLKQLLEDKYLTPKEERKLVEKLKIEILERDDRDQNRKAAPTKAADDAIIVDNSKEGFNNILGDMLKVVREKLS